MALLPDESVDMILTDPPYNTGMTAKTPEAFSLRRKGKTPWMGNFFNDSYTDEEYLSLVSRSCHAMYKVLKPNKGAYVFINWKKLGIWIECLENAGFKVKNCIVWDKVIHGLNYQNYAYTHEFLIFAVKGDFFPNNKQGGEFYKDVWNISRRIDNRTDGNHHETEKEIKVIRIPIKHASNEGDIVLDPFMGSGTTALACKQLKRNFIGFELNEEYCKIANKKLAQEILL